jgi:capsular exopolysaccharide synthesis family protein
MDPMFNPGPAEIGAGKLVGGSAELAPHAWLDNRNLQEMQEMYGGSARERTLGDYWRIVRKRKWTIIVSLVVVVTAATLVSLRMTPIYDASVRIEISTQNTSLLKFREDQQQYSADNQETLIPTQISILQSEALALLVIRKLGLDSRPEFGGGAHRRATDAVPTAMPIGRENELISTFESCLKVLPVPNTSIVEVKYSSPNPQLAAEIANAIANTYIEQNIKARFDSTMQAADWLSKQLADLQIKVETSQAKLIQYQKAHSIVGTDDKQNLTLEKLNDLGKRLTDAQADRIQKESLYRIAKGTNPDDLASVLPESTLAALRTQRTQLQTQLAQLTTQFGSSYPKVLEVQNQLNQINKAYREELQNGVNRAQNEYFTAVQREQMLKAALDEQTGVANQLDENAIEYRILKQEADSNRQLYDGLLQKLKEASLAAGLNSSTLRIVDKARIPQYPARPNVPRNMLFAVLLGLVGGVAVAFALEAIDTTVRTPDQAQTISGLPVMAVIPLRVSQDSTKKLTVTPGLVLTPGQVSKRAGALVAYLEPQAEISEAYRTLRTSILLSTAAQPPRVLVFTSALPQDGKTMTSVNTAIVMAKQGKRVLLVDADLRRPSIHKAFGLRPEAGISNVLSGGAKWKDVVQATMEPTLFILPSGPLPPHPSELLGSGIMHDLLREWRAEYDHVLIDSPPLLSVTDAVLLSVQADMVALIVRSGQTTMGAVRNARDLLLNLKAPLRGIVLNAFDLSSPDYYYYYYSGSKYGGYYTDKNAPKLKVSGNDDAPDTPDDQQQNLKDAANS